MAACHCASSTANQPLYCGFFAPEIQWSDQLIECALLFDTIKTRLYIEYIKTNKGENEMKAKINGLEVTIGNKSAMLTLQQLAIFSELQRKSPNVATEKQLMELTRIQARHTLNQHMSTLRKKLRAFDTIEIVTHSKVGYQLKFKQ